MKIKTLIIHNIASIEVATIEFDGGILADQDLFLICGPTGAGKSTILDSICLALFGTTPRINDSNDAYIESLIEGDKKKDREKLKDPLHLVRKNAPDASVTLIFEGVDGKECKAIWSVRRKIRESKNKADAERYAKETLEDKLKRGIVKEWTLTDGDGVVYSKVKEVEQQIQSIIGMNYNQFCKTTMLAQGDFTEFLSSKADDKAEILEKLVGTELYSAVGKVINRTTLDKKNDLTVLSNELANTVFLSEDEIVERNDKIVSLQSNIRSVEEAKRLIDAKLKWIADSNRALADMESANDAMNRAQSALEAEDVKADVKKAELWLKTDVVRSAIKTRENCEVQDTKYKVQSSNLEMQFARAVSGYNALMVEVSRIDEEIQADNKKILDQSRYEDMYSNASVIIKAHEDVVANRTFVTNSQPKLTAYDKEIGALDAKLDDLQKAKHEAENDIADKERLLQKKQGELQKYGADDFDAEIKNLNAHKLLVAQTESAAQAWVDAKKNCDECHQLLSEKEVKYKQLVEDVQLKIDKLKGAEQVYNDSKGVYERTKASVEDHAKVLRSELQVGDHCPVCGKFVDKVLSDETFVNMLKPLEEDFRKYELMYTECNKALAVANANEKVCCDALKKQRNDTDKADQKVKSSYNVLKERCDDLGIVCNDGVITVLDTLKSQDAAKETELSKRLEVIKDIRTQIDSIVKDVTDIRKKKLAESMRDIESVNGCISKLKADKQNLSGMIEAAKNVINTKQQYIVTAVNPDWKPSDDKSFYTELEDAARAYDKLKAGIISKQSRLEQYRNDCSLIEDCKNSVLDKFGEWNKYEDNNPQNVDGLNTLWTKLQSSVYTLASNISKNAADKHCADKSIEEFFDTFPDIDVGVVKSLMAYTASDIEQIQQRIKQLSDQKVSAEAKLEAARKQMEALSANPLADGDTQESLIQLQMSIGNEIQANSQEIGRLNSELDADKRNRETHGKKKQKLETLQSEYDEWKMLDDYLGSTDGKRFRNVAQSFILGDLLDKANAYLENITGRYKLFCNPGTLTIMMRDAYQGGVVRPTNTLSGGESFIISLSLALGLSSMQSTGFEVDTLFIDEGFGTLSPEFLDPVITSLKRLYEQYGRRVGIISHVESLKSKIPVTIEVTRDGSSSSKVEIVTC